MSVENAATDMQGTAKGSFPIAALRPVVIKTTAPASFEGAIFDLDGTLIDSMAYWENLGPRYLVERGKTPEPDASEKFKQLTIEESAVYMKETYGLKESADEIYKGIIGGIEEPYRSLVPLKPGVARMLDAFDAAGVRMCIATASEKELVVAALNRLGVAHHFRGIYTCPEVGVSKSRPDVFEWALRELGTPRSTTVVFEDSLHAIKTAKQAGFPVVAVRERTAADDADSIEQLADAVVGSFADMEETQ